MRTLLSVHTAVLSIVILCFLSVGHLPSFFCVFLPCVGRAPKRLVGFNRIHLILIWIGLKRREKIEEKRMAKLPFAQRMAVLAAFQALVTIAYFSIIERSKAREGSFTKDGYDFWEMYGEPKHKQEQTGAAEKSKK